jgi:hypothetical protein
MAQKYKLKGLTTLGLKPGEKREVTIYRQEDLQILPLHAFIDRVVCLMRSRASTTLKSEYTILLIAGAIENEVR